jgi:hypothetical protein
MKGLSLSTPMVIAWNEGRLTALRVRMFRDDPGNHCVWWCGDHWQDGDALLNPPYRPGETVYIKESFRPNTVFPIWFAPTRRTVFMKASAARLFARIVSVKPERIREITEEEAIREGIETTVRSYGTAYRDYRGAYGAWFTDPITSYRTLWESLHPGSWGKNEWVWRIALEKVKP